MRREQEGKKGSKKERRDTHTHTHGDSGVDMGLCAVLLICLSQAELARVWAQEQTGKTHTHTHTHTHTASLGYSLTCC